MPWSSTFVNSLGLRGAEHQGVPRLVNSLGWTGYMKILNDFRLNRNKESNRYPI